MIRKVMFIFACVMVFSISVVSAQDTPPTFVLVHGAFQDASGWAGVVANLEAEGYTTVTVELAGRGEDTTPLGEITLDNYRDAVIEVIEAQEQPVILVGHSFGGITISSVAEAIPDRIQALVYLSAYLPRTEESLVSLSAQDHYSVLGQEGNFILAEDFTSGLSLTSPPGPLSNTWRGGEKRILKSPLYAMGRGFRGGVNA